MAAHRKGGDQKDASFICIMQALQAKWNEMKAKRKTMSWTDEAMFEALKEEYLAKAKYCDPMFGYCEVMEIVSKTDDATLLVQAITNNDLMDPLTWPLQPPRAIIQTVTAILLLFGISIPTSATDEVIWRQIWFTWLTKNLDLHARGWEWMISGEPVGLFTKPYALKATHLHQVKSLVRQAQLSNAPVDNLAWQRMPAYATLLTWAHQATSYVHMKHHCCSLPSMHNFQLVQQLTMPPARRPKPHVWYEGRTGEGLPFYYNRVTQECHVEKPAGLLDALVDDQPSSIMQSIMEDALTEQVHVRTRLEALRKQRLHDVHDVNNVNNVNDNVNKSVKKKDGRHDAWIKCYDGKSQRFYYYHVASCTLRFHPPSSSSSSSSSSSVPSSSLPSLPSSSCLPNTWVLASASLAYAATVRIQSWYRMKLAQRWVVELKRSQRRVYLPSSITSDFYFHA